MADLTKTIGSGKDHATLLLFEGVYDDNAWYDSYDNLIAECTGSVSADQTVTYWMGWNAGQSAAHKIIIQPASGQEPDGLTDSKGAICNGEQRIDEPTNAMHMIWHHLEFCTGTSNDQGIAIQCDGGGVLEFVNLFFRDFDAKAISTNGISADVTIRICGCLFTDCGIDAWTGAVYINDGSVTTAIPAYNCTAAGCTYGFAEFSTTVVNCFNCAAGNCGTDFSGVATTNCGSEDGDADFVITMGDGEDFTEPTADDYTPVASADLDISGTALPSWYTDITLTDLRGNTWPANPPCGCYAFPAAGGLSIPNAMRAVMY